MTEEPRIITKEGFDEKLPKIERRGDVWRFRSQTRDVWISDEKLREIKKLYCDSPPLTINQICRVLDIPRPDFYVIKTALGMTHDDVPYLEDEMETRSLEELVKDTNERRKEKYMLKLQQSQVDNGKKFAEKALRDEYFLEKVSGWIMDHMKEFAQTYQGPPPRQLDPATSLELMLEVSIVDLHLSKLAWKPETGENYDYKIARSRFDSVIDDIIMRVKDRPLEKILFVVGQDFFHFDNVDTTTTAGTLLDADMRWPKMFGVGAEMLVRGIDRLATIAPVEVFHVPGNHDTQTSFFMIKYLYAWYRNTPEVTVNPDPESRKYIEFGKCLIGFTHGDKEKGRIFGNMQVEVPKAWGRTKYREWHTAHIHSEEVKENHGITVRRLTSITGKDAWHVNQGYVGSLCRNQSFIWDKEKGLYEILYSNIEV